MNIIIKYPKTPPMATFISLIPLIVSSPENFNNLISEYTLAFSILSESKPKFDKLFLVNLASITSSISMIKSILGLSSEMYSTFLSNS